MSGRRRTEGEIADGIAVSLARAAVAEEIAPDLANREAEQLRLWHTRGRRSRLRTSRHGGMKRSD